MSTKTALHEELAQKLVGALDEIDNLTAFLGFDGFVDEIIHVVDKRHDAATFDRLNTITEYAERIEAAAGKSTNIELVTQLSKLGGNGPIMANALASFGVRVTYLGNVGYPTLHPIFQTLANHAEVHSIADPCHTDALEFFDGKILLGKHTQLKDVTWENIQTRFGRDRFAAKFNSARLVGFLNWTMLPAMSHIWERILDELCPILTPPRQTLFFDLADPEKRHNDDIAHALELIGRFQPYFDVVLGLNEKESSELAEVLGLKPADSTKESLSALARQLRESLQVSTVVVHPTRYALASDENSISHAEGPKVVKPVITTGGGDHFNAGFCLGKLLNLGNDMCVLSGVATSGFYVGNGRSPSVLDLVNLLKRWPKVEAES